MSHPIGTTIEQALARGEVWALMRNGRYWKIRQNGAMRIWKTRPNEFRIPVKAGLKSCAYITEISQIGFANPQNKPDFLITSSDPNEGTA